MTKDREYRPDIGGRLYRIRRALGYGGKREAKKFARRYGFSEGAWWHWEQGLSVPWPQAIRIRALMKGLTLDYIYLGEDDGLTVDVARRLGLGPTPDGGRTFGLGKENLEP